ncbi:MAG: DUF2798 domain-containing protein [Marinospirillum sp.]|uniref:DUF2798 domain-containing protein n=1 Tax=Marinospirillum sp. TaxID=2183934 RepID=UPI0019F615FF|nr:DUF2798 domain-containing protein [Marinospirillum sp.]MBE0508452.1 DUF2798 domain-containing protein [Marinospirillum sp.]
MLFPPRFARYVFSFIMSIYMVSIMTFVITLVNTGIDGNFVARWWRAFYIAWPIAFVLILVGAPKLQTLAARLIKKAPQKQDTGKD